MRPVDRGDCPTDSEGNSIQFHPYDKARNYLEERLGNYCSYCEKVQPEGIEHILPKSIYPQYEETWDNFILACKNCNSVKGYQDLDISNYYWPDRDNTAYIFEYKPGGSIEVNSKLLDEQKQKARRTLKLIGLDRHPSNSNKPTKKDRRWINRKDAWGRAKKAWQSLQRCNTSEMREMIIDQATAIGFWSVWMAVFREDRDMLQRLFEAFPGTRGDCFDENFHPIPIFSHEDEA